MNRLEKALRDLARELDRNSQRWCLIGGLAVSARTEPRFTRDIDVAVAVSDDAAAERLIFALTKRGYRPIATIEQQAAGRLATVRLVPPDEDPSGVIADLLFSSSGIEPETVMAAESIELFPGLEMPVARSEHLITLKLLALDDVRRPQDRADLNQLLATMADPERVRAEVRRLIDLVGERRCDREKDLHALFDALLKRR